MFTLYHTHHSATTIHNILLLIYSIIVIRKLFLYVMLLDNPSVQKIFRIMNNINSEIRLVGGCVRDFILSQVAYDIDFATILEPNNIIEIFNSHGIKAIPTGLKHGTVTLIINNAAYEITTLRRDISCNGRWANIEFTNDWKEDASRRDFTFNAMYIDNFGNIYDYFNGRRDLQNGQLRFVGDPVTRISEDYLRILRAFRFYVRFCSKPLSSDIKFAIKHAAININKLSGERIYLETVRLLKLKNSAKGLSLMVDCGVFPYVFLSNSSLFSWLTIFEKINFDVNNEYVLLKLVLLIKENNIDKLSFFKRWKLSNKEKKTISFLLDNVDNYNLEDLLCNLRRIVRKIGKNTYVNLVKIVCIVDIVWNGVDFDEVKNIVYTILSRVKIEIVPQILISGNDLLKIGLHGKFIGLCMEKCWEAWEDSLYNLSKNELLNIAVQYMEICQLNDKNHK